MMIELRKPAEIEKLREANRIVAQTLDFLESQIKKAEQQRDKSEKMYRTLGMLIGMAIVIILM